MADPAPASPDINRGPQILAICGTLVGVAATTVLLRIWVRVTITCQLGWDDGFILAAVAVMLAEMVVIVPEVHYGAGRHVQYIHPSSNIVKGLHLNFVTQPLCLISLCFTKVSVGLFLLRLKPSWRFVLFIRGVIVFTVLSAAGNLCKSCVVNIYKMGSGADNFSDRFLPMHTTGLRLGPLGTGWKVHCSKGPQVRRFLQFQRVSSDRPCLCPASDTHIVVDTA